MYKHGNYANISFANMHDAASTKNEHSAPVYVGTLPVHTIPGGKKLVNKPILLTDWASAVKTVGYTDDWEKFTLCEAMYAHFVLAGAGPIVVINVFDPATGAEEQTVAVTAVNNQLILANMGLCDLDTVAVASLTRGTDFEVIYDYVTEKMVIQGLTPGVLTGEKQVTYSRVKPAATKTEVIGATDGEGTDSGLYLLRQVYQKTGKIPSRILCPGTSDQKEVHDAMLAMSRQVNGHFDSFIFTDLPLQAEGPVKPLAAVKIKAEKGYTGDNEKVHWPMWKGTDGRKYHLSVLAAAAMERFENAENGIPYQTASNTEMLIGGEPYYGEGVDIALDEELTNQILNQNGVTSCNYHGGKWVIWGSHTASYTPDNATSMNVYDTNLAMMYYIANSFQVRRADEIDKPVSINRIAQIVAEEQAQLDMLVASKMLLYGRAYFTCNEAVKQDMLNGDFEIRWEITPAIGIKSITGSVQYSSKGFETFYAELLAMNQNQEG